MIQHNVGKRKYVFFGRAGGEDLRFSDQYIYTPVPGECAEEGVGEQDGHLLLGQGDGGRADARPQQRQRSSHQPGSVQTKPYNPWDREK